ncbi:MAG: hypothetical protein WDN28_29640 [Chthoniobacter sp.]
MLSLLPVAPVIVAEMDPVPVITGMIALFMLIGLAVFVRIKKRWADFRQVAENHGFTVAAQRPSFARHWRTLATQSEGAWTLEIREEQVPRDENEDYFQELTLRLPAAGGLEFLFRPKSHWRKLEPEGDARYVQTGDAEFDGAWLMETNQPALLRTALDSELRAHFAGDCSRRPASSVFH